jgi:predicted O-methyltransferase YrrM
LKFSLRIVTFLEDEMPDLEWNSNLWDRDYDWSQAGEEWSAPWGDSEAQWFGSLYPRLHKLLPSNSILEIGPGFGRWTRFLLLVCNRYVGVDLSQSCIDACQDRFAKASHARFVRNDGKTLPSIGRFDLVFSFDSLVHADFGVMRSYIPQIISLLTVDGIAFLHHSNEAAVGVKAPHGYRAEDVSADLVADIVHGYGGHIILQETINWNAMLKDVDTDAITVFGVGKSKSSPRRIRNLRFLDEAAIIAEMQRPYCDIR